MVRPLACRMAHHLACLPETFEPLFPEVRDNQLIVPAAGAALGRGARAPVESAAVRHHLFTGSDTLPGALEEIVRRAQ
jgi:hypothetical protein